MIDARGELAADHVVQELLRRVSALERLAALAERIPALEREVAALREGRSGSESLPTATAAPAPPAPAPESVQLLERVWAQSPLPPRLEFLRALIDASLPISSVLQEAQRLLALFDRREDLEGWLRDYPSMFAEACATVDASLPPASGDLELLIHRTLGEARHRIETQVRLLGVEWIDPAPGDPITDAHSVVEDSPADGVVPGKISACRRRGLRWQGKVHLPALVTRQPVAVAGDAAGNAATEFAPLVPDPAAEDPEAADPADDASEISVAELIQELAPPAPALPHPPPQPRQPQSQQPSWLVGLQRSTPDGDPTTAGALTRGLAELVTRLSSGNTDLTDYEITVALKPLLSLLGSAAGAWRPDLPRPWTDAFQRGRPELLAWLSDHLALEIFVPVVGEAFSLTTMQMTAERRTAHPHEWGTVARVEAPGLLREGQVLLPARVVRYESGGAD